MRLVAEIGPIAHAASAIVRAARSGFAGLKPALFALLAAVGAFTSAHADPLRIVAFGDSNTYGYKVDRQGTFPAQLERILRDRGYDVSVANGGRNMASAARSMARLETAVPDGTDAAIVFLGRNDWRRGTPEVTIHHYLDEILSRLGRRGIEVLLVGFRPLDFSAIAARHDALYYPDFFAGVTALGRKRGRYVVNGDPFRHLNAAGYAVVAEQMLPTVVALVQRANGTASP